MKILYLAAWIFTAFTFLVLIISGFFNELSLIVFGLSALAFFYSFALLSAYLNRSEYTIAGSKE
ncbi:MAG: hypothetical protein R2681_07895 [Pyrinomonadaceae bacterium]